VTLAHSSFVVVFTVHCVESRPLAAVARTSHHVFSKRTPLLDGRLQILVGLLLDGLCVL